MNNIIKKINLPALKGQIGDWLYYVAVMKFQEIANRVKLPKEIDEYNSTDEKKLGEWIQREIDEKRIKNIIDYLNGKEQRFFNSLILGIYGGSPSWQELSIKMLEDNGSISEESMEYMEQTFGVLTLNGDESIFAIDGQHRAIGIRGAVKNNSELANEEVTVLFVAHKTDNEGLVRTRRLFSTLNRYAKPVNKSEIIALSEDDNCAIITRNIIENYPLFNNRILLNKNKVINPDNTTHFTNVLTLYDGIETLLSNKKILKFEVDGYSYLDLVTNRKSEEELNQLQKQIEEIFNIIIESIPSIKDFFDGQNINRKEFKTSLLFRPIGQNILFAILKVAKSKDKFKEAILYFAKDDFNLEHPIWHKVFWDNEANTLFTDKSKQNFATLLILEKIGIEVNRISKDKEVFDNYGFTVNDI